MNKKEQSNVIRSHLFDDRKHFEQLLVSYQSDEKKNIKLTFNKIKFSNSN